jgi:hypothetical protein
MVAVENADVLRSCLGCLRCVDARRPRPKRCGLCLACGLTLEKNGLYTLWRRFVIRSGAQSSAAQRRKVMGGCVQDQLHQKGFRDTLADEIPRVKADIR